MSNNYGIDPYLIEQTLNCLNTCIFDESISLLYVNENFSSLIGFSKEELIGKTLLHLKDYQQPNSNYEFLVNTIKQGEVWKGELQLHHKKKHPVYLDVTINPIVLHDKSIRYIATFLDIQHRKLLFDNLKQRAHQQSLIAILGQLSLNNIPINDLLEQTLSVVCGSLNIDSGVVLELSVNGKKALVRTSYNSPELHPDETLVDIEKNSLLEHALLSDKPYVCKSLINEKEGFIPKIFLNKGIQSAIFSVIGDLKYPFGILSLLSKNSRFLNIDEAHFLQSVCNILAEAINRKNMEKALRHEQKLSKNYLDVAEVIFIVIDRDEKILLANMHAAEVLGYSQTELAGMSFFDVFTSESTREKSKNEFKNLLNNKKIDKHEISILKNATPIINKQKITRFIKWKNSALHDDDGEINSVLYAGEDVTDLLEYEREQKSLEQQLNQAQKMEAIGMLAGGIAHDFNNILASILGFSDLAFELLGEKDKKLYEYLTQIKNSGIKARDIVAQMQSINLHDETSTKATILPSLLKGTLKMLRSAMPSSINMQVDIKNDIPAAYINASKFNQIVMHLLANARNATNGKGSIFIDLSLVEFTNKTCSACHEIINSKYVVFSVRDDGPGFNTTDFSYILDNHKTSTPSGLALISKLVHESSGHIIITDHQYDTEFFSNETSIQLLLDIPENHPQIEQKHNISNSDISKLNSKHLMIVDDENSVATFMGELFKSAGFKVSVYCDSAEALNVFKSQPDDYDLIVTDQTMPILTGDILAAKMIELKPELPIIICSGHNDIFQHCSAQDLKVSKILKKPVESTELLHTVMSLLSKNSMHNDYK